MVVEMKILLILLFALFPFDKNCKIRFKMERSLMKFTSNLISKTETESRRKRRFPGIENPATSN